MRVVVIGAGPTAMGAVHRLFEASKDDPSIEVTIIEREPYPGGLASTVTDTNGFSWDLGIHVTGATRFPEFVQLLQEAVPEWHCLERIVKADMSHVLKIDKQPEANYVPYPVQSSVPYFPEPLRSNCLRELEGRVDTDLTPDDFESFEEFTKHFFGKSLQEVFIRPYNRKVWTVSLSEMNTEWVNGRVPQVDIDALRNRCLLSTEELRKYDSVRGINFFRYPADCIGMGELWRRIATRYPANWFQLNTEVTDIDAEQKIISYKSVSTGKSEKMEYDYVISTMPLTILGKITGLCNDLKLRHSKVALVGIGLKFPQSDFAQQLSWAYFPRPDIVFYRCTVISNFSPLLVPDAKKYWSVLCEIGLDVDDVVNTGDLAERTTEGLLETGIIPSAEQITNVWTRILDYGYPIPTTNRKTELARATEALEKHDIYSRGRFGAWKYETSNQDCSFDIGNQVAVEILRNRLDTK
uniref:Amino_oxidase domain-containing protein n=1 Tax=Panagrellus redivivus TaxID=6233 RepID=A0A7E4ZRL3_PANRE